MLDSLTPRRAGERLKECFPQSRFGKLRNITPPHQVSPASGGCVVFASPLRCGETRLSTSQSQRGEHRSRWIGSRLTDAQTASSDRWASQAKMSLHGRGYSPISSMEFRVENATGQRSSRSSVVVATSASARVPTLVGAACHEFKIPASSQMGLYTKDNVMLCERRTVNSLKLKAGETLYLRTKDDGDDLLFLLNWRILSVGFILLALVGLAALISVYASTANRRPFVYGVVIDAGSSHSEATLYHWHGSKYYGTGKAEQVAHVETHESGISSLLPRDVFQSLGSLLESVKSHVPASKIDKTKVYLGATAGMRLLNISNSYQTDLTLLAAEAAIKGSGFRYGSAEILSGQDEGIFAWLSSNYLLDRIPQDSKPDGSQPPIGALDLGGASTQIAFEVKDDWEHREVRNMKLYGRVHRVFARSYLCFGINEAYNRYLMLLLRDQNYDTEKPIESPCHNKGFDGSIALGKILTPCTEHGTLPRKLYQMNFTDLRIVGSDDSTTCYYMANNMFPESDCRSMGFAECFAPLPRPAPTDIDYAALSGFVYNVGRLDFNASWTMANLRSAVAKFCQLDYDSLLAEHFAPMVTAATTTIAGTDAAVSNGLDASGSMNNKGSLVGSGTVGSNDSSNGGTSLVLHGGIVSGGSSSNSNRRYAPSACFNLNYIYNLLASYGISDETLGRIQFRRKARGYNLGWSLGYMINETNVIPEAEPQPALIPLPWFIVFAIIFTCLLAAGLLAAWFYYRRSKRVGSGDRASDVDGDACKGVRNGDGSSGQRNGQMTAA